MIKLNKINWEELEKNLKNRFINLDINTIKLCFNKVKNLKKEIESLRHSRLSKNDKDCKEIKLRLLQMENDLNQEELELEKYTDQLPNILHHSVPVGEKYEDSLQIEQKGQLVFTKHHYEMDIFHPCSDFIGNKFIILKSNIAKLERALINFMTNSLDKLGFEEISAPYIINEKGLKNSNHLPKGADDMFKIADSDKYLIPTSETTILNIGQSKIWNEDKFFFMFSDCFRKEAGSANKNDKGLIRLHQFKKCEMFCFAQPNNSYNILEKMLKIPLNMLKELEIPYRTILLSSGDSPFNSAKTYDIEIPIGNQWREVSSVSNCTDIQTNNINCKNNNKEFLHAINGSALAVGRTLASFLEVHYNKEKNSIFIPLILRKYLELEEILL